MFRMNAYKKRRFEKQAASLRMTVRESTKIASAFAAALSWWPTPPIKTRAFADLLPFRFVLSRTFAVVTDNRVLEA